MDDGREQGQACCDGEGGWAKTWMATEDGTLEPYHIISYHIISYHIISYHIISYHIISYTTI
jgi:hypothetical protein